MKFDIKDLKSWSNRQDVKVGDKGYFCERIKWLQNGEHIIFSTIECIDDDASYCFVPRPKKYHRRWFLFTGRCSKRGRKEEVSTF